MISSAWKTLKASGICSCCSVLLQKAPISAFFVSVALSLVTASSNVQKKKKKDKKEAQTPGQKHRKSMVVAAAAVGGSRWLMDRQKQGRWMRGCGSDRRAGLVMSGGVQTPACR